MGVAMAVGSAALGLYGQNKALEAQGRANAQTAKNLLMSMNYSLQNMEQERADAFDATIDELEKLKIQGNRLTSQVSASVNEGLAGGGRTANLIKRASQADVDRSEVNAKENYHRKSNEIDLNKESVLLSTKNQIGSIKQVEKPSILSSLMTLGTAYYSGLQTQEAIKAIQSKSGVDKIGSVDPTHKIQFQTSLWKDEPSYSHAIGFKNGVYGDSSNFSFGYKNPYDLYETKDNWTSMFNFKNPF